MVLLKVKIYKSLTYVSKRLACLEPIRVLVLYLCMRATEICSERDEPIPLRSEGALSTLIAYNAIYR